MKVIGNVRNGSRRSTSLKTGNKISVALSAY